ncbi:exodeoxyribonuclease I [Candidatus Thioglobus sp.]|uniref:exodeoxyribonuclease I n=1 Tax=Candidatus Thioglobus sp. TaxID=2026721 RepID=UPI002604ECED|nr:exodeoxyribonuclease I [Candidatus Thioglobus sp.]MDG2395588.1 exodeoxyribonuclease I [Candidatus Thioglobus sp.]
MKTYYWYDYETFGINPKTDRISQFAGIRTDENLNILDEHMFYCKPTNDCLPSPEACNVTGITPQLCAQKGMIEHEFIKKIQLEFATPNTCIAGYNSIRFDDEFTRYTLYRNFMDPYAWHWQNGNTRWDILDVVRMCYALKKDNSLKWVYDDNGKPIFKLDRLSPANGIEHANAHDALADVRATIALARIIKSTQPGLFDHAFKLREKKFVESSLNLFEPMLHTSGMYPADKSCTRLSVALAYHPQYNDRAIVFNLDQDPSVLLEMSTDELRTLTFTKQAELPSGVNRLQIKDLVFNKSPMFVTNIYKIDPKIAEQLQINMELCLQHLTFIKYNQVAIEKAVQDLYSNNQDFSDNNDVDQSLYGGFMDNTDKRIAQQLQTLSITELKNFHPKFKDEKLANLLIHFKARNYPECLTDDEAENWFEIVQGRVQAGENGYLSIDQYFQRINIMREQYPQKESLWQQLESYGESFF